MTIEQISKNLAEISNYIRNPNEKEISFEKMVEYLESLGYAETCIKADMEKYQEETREEY